MAPAPLVRQRVCANPPRLARANPPLIFALARQISNAAPLKLELVGRSGQTAPSPTQHFSSSSSSSFSTLSALTPCVLLHFQPLRPAGFSASRDVCLDRLNGDSYIKHLEIPFSPITVLPNLELYTWYSSYILMTGYYGSVYLHILILIYIYLHFISSLSFNGRRMGVRTQPGGAAKSLAGAPGLASRRSK